ncbi:Replication protein A 70 kDa DNA-binding subunit A [Arachis hypogaea]|nr:Replication protein A 70 kDa DNA-binding subunit A [Arachis hypogaea]
MAENFDYLADVNAKTLHWSFKVFVVRAWDVPSRFNDKEVMSMELGHRLQASIPKPLVKKWKDVIVEFQMYTMKNFVVLDNTTYPKVTPDKYILVFSHRTRVHHVEHPSFPLDAFRLKSFKELLNADKLDDSELIDIIGEVVGKEDPRDLVTSKGVETKRLAIILQDLDNNKISCALFGKMVDELLPHLHDGRVEPLIVVLQYFKPNRWNGKTSVQSHFYVSKLHINDGLKEVVGFRNRLLSGVAASSSRISQVSSQGGWSGADEINQGAVLVKTIEQALNVKEEGPIWICASIVSLNVGKDDWFYKSCRKCPKKVDTPIGNRYECTRCGHTHGCASLRFKVQVMVHDGTGSITLLLWDKETSQLCGKKAEQVMEDDVIGDDAYPPTFDNMMDRKVLFKINVKSANIKGFDQIYTVMKICDDEDIIEKNMPKEIAESTSTFFTEIGGNNSLDMSENIVNIKSDTDPQFTLDGMEECISTLKCKTPGKRTTSLLNPANQEMNENEDEGQLSTNRGGRKGVKKIKANMAQVQH